MWIGNSCQNSLTPNSRSTKLLNHTNKFPEKKYHKMHFIKFIVSGNLRMHMEQAQYDQASMNMTIKHGLTK